MEYDWRARRIKYACNYAIYPNAEWARTLCPGSHYLSAHPPRPVTTEMAEMAEMTEVKVSWLPKVGLARMREKAYSSGCCTR